MAMSQWVEVKSGYINLAHATDIHVVYSKDPDIKGVVSVIVYQGGEIMWSGQSERPNEFGFDPEGVQGVLREAGGRHGYHGPVFIPAPD